MNDPLYQQAGYDFMKAAFEVYNEMGNGYTEDIYQECLEDELTERKIAFRPQAELTISYKNKPLRRTLHPDLMVSEDIIVELRAAKILTAEHYAQVLNYLKATGKSVAYLVNFGNPQKLEWKRFVRSTTLAKASAN